MPLENLSPSRHPYPLVRSAGLFLLVIGAGLLAGLYVGGREPIHRPTFFVATALGFTALFAFADRLSFGPPRRKQLLALAGAIALEIALLTALSLFMPRTSARDYWLWTLFIVGVHFLPMAYTFGPAMVALGSACMVVAFLGLASAIPFSVAGSIDGLLKMVFGAAMLSTRPTEHRSSGRPEPEENPEG